MHRRPKGFTLLELALGLAVAAILASGGAAAALRILNHQREAQTRVLLKAAFEGIFGAMDRQVPNMRADFGFNPRASFNSLPFLVAKPDAWTSVPAMGPQDVVALNQLDTPPQLYWGYNGPYWKGPTAQGLPLDAWGTPIGLVYQAGTNGNPDTWQVRSLGPSKREGAGNLVYPPVPASASRFNATLAVRITNSGQSTFSGRYYFVARSGQVTDTSANFRPLSLHADGDDQRTFSLGTGSLAKTFQFPGGRAFLVIATNNHVVRYEVPLYLLPGERKEMALVL